MKYSRGRIIALTILSVTMVLSLFGASLIYNFRDTIWGVAADTAITDPNYIPTFDDLYQRIPFDKSDTGTTDLGQGAKLTLLEESYESGVLSEFVNSSQYNARSYRDLQSRRREGYPCPIFTNADMRLIAGGLGNNLEIPVVMLDPYNTDDIVLFELTNISDMPTDLVITRDGVVYQNGVNLITVSNSVPANQVYSGVPTYTQLGTSDVILDADGKTVLLNVAFVPNSKVDDGYIVEVKDPNGNFLYTRDSATNELSQVQAIDDNVTVLLYDSNGILKYYVIRMGTTIVVRNASNEDLGQITYNKTEHQLTSYSIGAVAYNSQALRGMFQQQGLYEISFKQRISTGDGVYALVDVSFAFIIVNKINYIDFPRFDTKNRVPSRGEIYNYSYESEYPVVNFSKLYFDVEINTTSKYYENDALVYDDRELMFYNIGEYKMVSQLQYYSEYLFANRQRLNKRGVKDGYVKLKHYTDYPSVLNVLGFQAYYGGQHFNNKYDGPLPFYDNINASVSSDISSWVRDVNMTADKSGAVVDYSNMRVSDALKYSTELAEYITTSNAIRPVRTNFPPVKLFGNVPHATRAGVLSTVAYRPSFGTGNVKEWQSRSLDVGAPFEAAGEYVVVIYFEVNDKLCQQTFYFEIVNSAQVAFEVTANGVTKTYYAGELELNKDLQDLCLAGNKVKLSYGGKTTLGQFEVLPTITLAYANFGQYNFTDQNITMGDDGSFEFNLNPGQYRLTIKYGAHGKSTTVFNVIVDNSSATGIKANTSAKSLSTTVTNLPDNVAIVGAGDVTLTWDDKISGINYSNVLCEFYEMALENQSFDPNANANYTRFPTVTVANLYSAYVFSQTVSSPNNGYHPVKTETGWTLSEKFTTPGLYRFTLVDDVGNETPFVLIIDDSKPTFIQSGEKPSSVSNVINFDDNVGVKIGFGTHKLIKHQNSNTFSGPLFQDVFTGLSNAGVLVNSGTRAIGIGITRVERSDSGEFYYDVDAADMRNGYLTLTEEGTYYFRVTDVLGNIGEYYIVLTHDNCFGMVYAEAGEIPLATGSQYKDRGMVELSPNVGTSLVTTMGGMTNRPYVIFSFMQKPAGSAYCVDQVVMQYYPLTYELKSVDNPAKPNPNYPFAEKPKNNPHLNDDINAKEIFANQDYNGLIYSYDAAKDGDGGTINLALFNTGTTTPAGLYILTRTYASAISGSDTPSRDYYFIVDNQNMLYYAENIYQTALKVHFADKKEAQYPKAKDADAAVINRNDNKLSSNRTAWVYGFNSKYSWLHDSTTYTIADGNFNYLAFTDNNPLERFHNFTFPALAPRFSYTNNSQTVILGEGNQVWSIGDPATRTDDTVYQMLIADNARNISCVITNGNIVELFKPNSNAPTSANWDYLTLNLETGYGASAEIVVGENKVISNTRMEYDGNNYTYIVDPHNIDQLEFRFVSDPESMYADIDLDATMDTWTWTANGVEQQVSLQTPIPEKGLYTFDLMQGLLNDVIINNGSSLSVSLLTYDGTRTDYIILFDRYEPNYNLTKVKAGDNLASIIDEAELPGGYIYGLSSDFVFESDQINNHYLDTKVITYREVDYTGEGSQAATQFKLYTGANGEARIPFATLVGLRDNEMRYYYIAETDYAGHTTSYIVQIQGENYVNAVSFIGAITEENSAIQIGIEMHASSSSVHQFFLRNNSFRFESGEDYYMVLGSKASWHIGDDIGSGNKNEDSLIKALNNWINIATKNGSKCSYTLYDRIGTVETFEFYNLRENAAQMQLDCYQPNILSNLITLEVKNMDNLPRILFDENLASAFKIEIEDRNTSEKISNVSFSLYGTSIYVDVSHEYVIRVTDPFGRVSATEYHQQAQSTINFTAFGNTVLQDGVVYIGDQRGAEFNYLRTVYTVLFYDVTNGGFVDNLQSVISDDMIYYSFRPREGQTTIQTYRIVATGRASGAIMFDQYFAFDTRLPSVEWKNSSDQLIQVEGQSFVSSVIMDISNSVVNTMFPTTISYTRTLNNQSESVTLDPGTLTKTFYQVGAYEVTLRNTVWAQKTYKFEIVQVDDTLVLVYDDGKHLQPSTSDYKFDADGQEIMLTRYVFTMAADQESGIPFDVYEYKLHGLEIKVGQTNRVLAGNYEMGTDYYYCDIQNNTLVWRLAFYVGENSEGVPAYTSPVYFATTGVPSNLLPNDNSIALRLNGNPNNPTNNNIKTFDVVASRTAYNIIYNNYMTEARDKKLTVQLYCDPSVVRDDAGNPCYRYKGNLILVDCYYNGTLVQTLNYGDVFTINQNDAGYYEFEVHDLAGNYLLFGDNDNSNHVNHRQKRYMLAVMTRPIVVINDKQPVSGMIYNDQVELKLVDYGSDFLTKYRDWLVETGVEPTEKGFFNKYFCVTETEVVYMGSNGTTIETTAINGKSSNFYWSASGIYRVTITYRVYGAGVISSDLTAEYSFQIIPSRTIREEFSMPIYPDIPVMSVTRDGYNIHDYNIYIRRNANNDEYMAFDADNNPGNYVITLQTYDNLLKRNISHEVRFNIQHKANSASNYFVLSSASGKSTTNAVTVYYNPYWLYLAQGKVTIVLTKNYDQQKEVIVDSSILKGNNYNSQELFNVSDAGIYRVYVKDSEGDTVYSDSFTIEAKQSTFGYTILAVVLGIVGIGVLLFIRMRHKMTTK